MSASPDPTSQLPIADPPRTTPERRIDPRGHRFGAALSAVMLVFAFLVQAPVLVLLIGLALGVSSAFGTRYSVLGRPWPLARRALRLGPPAELESEYPPRFAQALGTLGLAIAVILFALGAQPWAWLPVAGVAALQTVLGATGYCLGCRLYFLRWYVPSLFDRLVRRSTPSPFSSSVSTRRFS